MIRQYLRKWLPDSAFRRPTRIDHGRMYMSCMFGLFVTSLSMILIGPIPESSLSRLNSFTQTSLAYVLLIGSSMCINGFLRGTKFYKPCSDIRDSLIIAKWSVPSIGASLGTYVWAIFNNFGNVLFSALGTSLALSILVGCLWNGWDFANEADRLDERIRKVNPDEHLG